MKTKLKTNLRRLQTGGIALLLLLCSCALSASGQADAPVEKVWDKTYGGDTTDRMTNMIALPDGGFLLGGWSYSNAGFEKSEDARGREDYWIVRVDAQGNKLWDKTYGGGGNDGLSSIVATADGGFLLGGKSNSDKGFDKSEDRRGGDDFWIVRVDAQGNKLWDKTYRGESWDLLSSIVAAADGGFLLGGRSYSNAGLEKSEDRRGGNDYWIMRIKGSSNYISIELRANCTRKAAIPPSTFRLAPCSDLDLDKLKHWASS